MLSQKPKLIRSFASDGHTNIYKRRVSLNIIQKEQNKFGRKFSFKIENESGEQNQSSPKLIGILTVLRCIFGLNLVGKIRLSCYNWPWRSIIPKNNRDLNQGLLHFWSKFGDSSLNEWWVIVRTRQWLIHTRTHKHTDTQTQTQATTIPEGQNWLRVKKTIKMYVLQGTTIGFTQKYGHKTSRRADINLRFISHIRFTTWIRHCCLLINEYKMHIEYREGYTDIYRVIGITI